jgi:replicative DNA helicase
MAEKENPKLGGTRRKAFTPAATGLEIGKIPPQAPDLEEAVLGAILIDSSALTLVVDLLKPEAFYVESNKVIYEAIKNLFDHHQPIDLLTVSHQLKKDGMLEIAGGSYNVSRLTNRVASSANIEFHARIIAQKYIQRELIKVSTETIREAYEDSTDVLDLLDKAESNLFQIAENNIRKNYQTMDHLIKEAIQGIQTAAEQKDGISGVPSGFTALDRVTAGWQKSDLIILAARPGMGKTAFVLALARNASIDFNIPIALFSLEMSSVQLVNRLISGETELSADKIKRGNLEPHEWQQLYSKITPLSEAQIFIDDTPGINIFELRAKVRRLKAEKNIGMIIIDYLQLMTGGTDNRGNREQEISTISRSLKGIAKELEVPVIVLSQLNRMVESRGNANKRPQLSDLRESGAIEQDADMVCFIYRPEYYEITQDANGNDLRGLAQIIIAKHRNGSLEDVNLRFIKERAKFADWDVDLSTIYDPGEGLAANAGNDFPTMTISSKLNEMRDDPF